MVWDDPRLVAAIREQDQLLQQRLDEGHLLVGWKLGLGAPATMRQVGISAPLVGHLTSATLLEPGATVAVGGWTKPVMEPEVGIVLGDDVRAGAHPATTAAAISGLAPAIELVDIDAPLGELATVLRGNIFHRHVVLGEARPADAADLRIRVRNRGQDIGATDDPEAATGRLVELVSHVAGWLERSGRRLQAGQVIIAGSVIPPVPVRPGDELDYSCEPLGRLSVALA